MENKQSAIEWAEDKLSDLNSATVNGEIAPEEYHEIRVNIWKKAKAMEKEQIRKSYYAGVKDEMQNIGNDFEDYYKQTYANDTTEGLPKENSKRRGWHY